MTHKAPAVTKLLGGKQPGRNAPGVVSLFCKHLPAQVTGLDQKSYPHGMFGMRVPLTPFLRIFTLPPFWTPSAPCINSTPEVHEHQEPKQPKGLFRVVDTGLTFRLCDEHIPCWQCRNRDGR